MELRIGNGIDIHAFCEQRHCIIGGVDIPFHKGLKGHSDADVLLHAIIDSILGAAGERDIGSFFPDTDPQWKNSNSLDLLKIIWQKISKDGWRINNIDCTILAEAPKLSPYIDEMKGNISKILEISTNQIGIKATTTEKLGFVGREEGVLASAVALIRRG